VASTIAQGPQGPTLYWSRSRNDAVNGFETRLFAQPLSASKPVMDPIATFPNSTSFMYTDPTRPGFLVLDQFVSWNDNIHVGYFDLTARTFAPICPGGLPFSWSGSLDYDRKQFFGTTDYTGMQDAVVTDLKTCQSRQFRLTCVPNPQDFQPDRVVYDGNRKAFLIMAWDQYGLSGFWLNADTLECHREFQMLAAGGGMWWNENYSPSLGKAVGILRQDNDKRLASLLIFDLAKNQTTDVVHAPLPNGIDFYQISALELV